MALSQVQCLDDHHVNWRVSESKPEFFYSEEQRVAVETLISQGPDAFKDYILKSGLREFLSETELERIVQKAEPYRPGHEHTQRPGTPGTPGPGNITPGSGEDLGDGEVSLQYWPDRSEASVAELDLGWPEAYSYRGVTRVTVHTQPPVEGHTHIKEVVRKSIAAAQKVIAVVMDVFTDVDIFRDLLDAGFKRRVPVYIIIDMAAVPCFLSMCARADMHRGHLKNLRVRCCGGVEFFTRSAQKVRGSLSQKFLLVDGDKAISGSYSFTWASSRFDRNLISVITGQAVETFDFQFRDLYLISRGVSLNKVPMADEPIPDPIPQAAPVPVSATVARKLINPKYALVVSGTQESVTSSDLNSTNKNSKNPTGLKLMKEPRKIIEEPPIHPALVNMEKAYLIPYLPTWPEPDPPSDVIGFINIRDEKRAHQVHLQRSERFEVSQAIRFSSPLLMPEKTEDSAPPQSRNQAEAAAKPAENVRSGLSSPTSPTKKQPKQLTQINQNADQVDSGVSPQQTDARGKWELNTQPTAPSSTSTVVQQPAEPSQKSPQAEAAAAAPPPVPKRRTLHLVLDPTPVEHSDLRLVTLMKIDSAESEKENEQQLTPTRARMRSLLDAQDSGSNDSGSQDSTKVICDRVAVDDPSSTSTASEEDAFYDCPQPEQRDPLTNGVTTGSGRGHRQGDRGNMMARLSQSMLDLREPQNSGELIRQSQQLRRHANPSPRRHIGQLFQTSSPDARVKGPKVVVAKPGSFHRPSRAAGPVIGGHRYWQSQMLQTDSSQLRGETRSGRSPRRHSPSYRKMDPPAAQQQSPTSQLLGIQFPKLNHLKHSRARGATSQKKASQTNKPAR